MQDTITLKELSDISGYDTTSLRHMALKGQLPPIKNGAFPAREALTRLFAFLQTKARKEVVYRSMQDCCNETGIPLAKIRAAKAAGIDAFKSGHVHLMPLLRWLFSGETKEALDPIYERARLYREQANKLELKNQMLRRELVDINEAREFVTGLLIPLRDRLFALESLASKCNQADPATARMVLRNWTDETITMIRTLAAGREIQLPQSSPDPTPPTKADAEDKPAESGASNGQG